MNQPTVLISGAGIAGSTLAFLLARSGFKPTLTERAHGLRSSGAPVDVQDGAFEVVSNMGIVPSLRDVASQVSALSFVDHLGKCVARIRLPVNSDRKIELFRSDLARILSEAARKDAEILFDESVVSLQQDDHGVDATFERAAPRRFDLVIGCDGLHSTVRKLAFGPERDHVEYFGLYVATFMLGCVAENPSEVVMYNAPNRAIAIHPGTGQESCAFMYRAPMVAGFNPRDLSQHRHLLNAAFRDVGWRALNLLERLETVEDFYFDSVSRVRLDRWWNGRIALLGDAASCVSLFGGGSSNAIAGAAVLARALAAEPAKPATAFVRYEREHRRQIRAKMLGVGLGSRLLIPATRPGIVARNLAARLWSRFGARPRTTRAVV